MNKQDKMTQNALLFCGVGIIAVIGLLWFIYMPKSPPTYQGAPSVAEEAERYGIEIYEEEEVKWGKVGDNYKQAEERWDYEYEFREKEPNQRLEVSREILDNDYDIFYNEGKEVKWNVEVLK